MTIAIKNGTYETLGGVPKKLTGIAELLQTAAMRIRCKQGSFRYGRAFGSLLHTLSASSEHAEELALAMANEALLGCGGVTATAVRRENDEWIFTVQTPYGTGEVSYGIV